MRFTLAFVLVLIGCRGGRHQSDRVETGFRMLSNSTEFLYLSNVDELSRKDSIYSYFRKLQKDSLSVEGQFAHLYLSQQSISNYDSAALLTDQFMRKHRESYLPYLLTARFVYDTARTTVGNNLASAYMDSAVQKSQRPFLLAINAWITYLVDTTTTPLRTLDLLDKAIQMDSNLYQALADKASVLPYVDNMENKDLKTKELLLKCMKLDSARSFAYEGMMNLTEALREQRQYLKSASRLGDKYADLRLANANFSKSYYKEAAEHFRKYLKADSAALFGDSLAVANFMVSLYLTNNGDEADQILKRYEENGYTVYSPFLKSQLLSMNGRYNDALIQLEKAIKKSEPEYQHRLHKTKLKYLVLNGRSAEASKYYQRYKIALDSVYGDQSALFTAR